MSKPASVKESPRQFLRTNRWIFVVAAAEGFLGQQCWHQIDIVHHAPINELTECTGDTTATCMCRVACILRV